MRGFGMNWGLILGIVGIAVTVAAVGVSLIMDESGPVGVFLVAAGFVTIVIVLVYDRILLVRQRLQKQANALADTLHQAAGKLEGTVRDYTDQLEAIGAKVGLPNDARFIPDGFIGLQRQAILVETNQDTGPDHARMAVLGHLPSYMRFNDLSESMGQRLYHNWQPPHYIPEYVNLVNQRSAALRSFIEHGGVVREIYEREKIEHYVTKRFTFHDRVSDPQEEIEERLRALLRFLDYPNYYVSLLDDPSEAPGHHFLLKQNVGLVLDLRTTDIRSHFTQSLEGLFTDSGSVLAQFELRFTAAARQTDRDHVRAFIEDMLRRLRKDPEAA